jgi:hypothetical protein
MSKRIIAAVLPVLLLSAGLSMAQDPIERLIQRGQAQTGDPRHHAHSDFTDNPLGRFMDYLAAGAFADARALQPAACASWRTNPQTAALSGRFRVWDTDIDLDTLCGRH